MFTGGTSSIVYEQCHDYCLLMNSGRKSVSLLQGLGSRLRSNFCKKFVHRIMSNEASCIKDHLDSNLLRDEMPSAPYQRLSRLNLIGYPKMEKSGRYTTMRVQLIIRYIVSDSKNGGYLTANMVNSLTYLISRMESAIVSTGFTLNKYAVDYKKVINSALQAIKELEALMEQKWHSYEDFDQLDEEYQARSSYNSIEDDDC
ncbi:exocyst complex component EXO84A-like protein [Tanacetum coccineum]